MLARYFGLVRISLRKFTRTIVIVFSNLVFYLPNDSGEPEILSKLMGLLDLGWNLLHGIPNCRAKNPLLGGVGVGYAPTATDVICHKFS